MEPSLVILLPAKHLLVKRNLPSSLLLPGPRKDCTRTTKVLTFQGTTWGLASVLSETDPLKSKSSKLGATENKDNEIWTSIYSLIILFPLAQNITDGFQLFSGKGKSWRMDLLLHPRCLGASANKGKGLDHYIVTWYLYIHNLWITVTNYILLRAYCCPKQNQEGISSEEERIKLTTNWAWYRNAKQCLQIWTKMYSHYRRLQWQVILKAFPVTALVLAMISDE